METAVTPREGSQAMFTWKLKIIEGVPKHHYLLVMHFAEFESLNASEKRVFDIYVDDDIWSEGVQPLYLNATTLYSIGSIKNERIRIKINSTQESTLPPIVNAAELYDVLNFSRLETDSRDVLAIMEVKRLCQVESNWMGDPCAPEGFLWDGLSCDHGSISSSPRIISLKIPSMCSASEVPKSIGDLELLQKLDLSGNGFTGGIPKFLSSLSHLMLLDLRGNNFTGSIPKELHDRASSGALNLRIESRPIENEKKDLRTVIGAIVGSICLIMCIISIMLLLRCHLRKKQKDGEQEEENTETLLHFETSQFTYNDLIGITENFATVIGEGGFGQVYLGVLKDNAQVAVKVLSKASSHEGLKQFQNEVLLLSKIHHKNLVSLVGYCKDPNHLALVYEYMEEGSIEDHLSGKAGNNRGIDWKKRLEIATGAAQGLEYLHAGCELSIIHRDVKPSNILLNRNMVAKIADFGISRIYESDLQSYLSTAVMGTPGYLDPEYHYNQKLKDKSDVYSFGVVLLQLAMGIPAIIRREENMHIIDWVRPWFQKGKIEEIIDKRLDGNYDIRSVQKMVQLALSCVSPVSLNRPTMIEVLKELRDCLDMENVSYEWHNQSTYGDEWHNQSTASTEIAAKIEVCRVFK